MAVLFREGTLWSKMVSTLTATWAHGKTLGKFAGVYKLILMALDLVKGHNAAAHSFIAGGVGGYLVWGDETSVNKQVTLYCFSRVCLGLAQSLNDPQGPLGRRLPNPLGEGSKKTHAVFAAFVWAMVMFLFEYDSKNLNGSLVASMRYIYHDSNRWKTISDFLPTYKAFATLDR
jgi:hypothetical protein